jgi:tripartite-type tricarboxylate transporter receptor subunit TctC
MTHAIHTIPAAAILLLCAAPLPAAAQAPADFPTQSVRIIVATSPGGALDATARAIGNKLSQNWNQQVVVDNRAGANGAIAYDLLAKSTPNGHTLMTASATHIVNALVIRDWPHDIQKVTAPLSHVASLYYVIYRHPSVPLTTLKEVIAYGRKNPNKLLYGTGGNANISHLGWEWLGHLSGAKFKHVAYKGASNAVKATIAGELHIGFSTVHSLRGHFESGRAFPLAVTAKQRLTQLPDVPAVAEFGMPEYEINQWYGIVTSAKVPPAITAKLSAAIIEAVKSPEVVQRLSADGSVPVGSTAAEFSAHLKAENVKWRKVLQDTGMALSGSKL